MSDHRRVPDDQDVETLESDALRQARRIAWLLDESVRLPGGFRFGLDGLLGLIPGIGDLLGLLASGRIVDIARREGVPVGVLVRMATNIGVDALVGAIPLVGDLFDFGWKANARNVELLAQELQRRPPAAREKLVAEASSANPGRSDSRHPGEHT